MCAEPTCEEAVLDATEDRLKAADDLDETSAKALVDLLRSKGASLKPEDVQAALETIEDDGHANS